MARISCICLMLIMFVYIDKLFSTQDYIQNQHWNKMYYQLLKIVVKCANLNNFCIVSVQGNGKNSCRLGRRQKTSKKALAVSPHTGCGHETNEICIFPLSASCCAPSHPRGEV